MRATFLLSRVHLHIDRASSASSPQSANVPFGLFVGVYTIDTLYMQWVIWKSALG